MPFKYVLQPEGPRDARIAVVCEKPATDEVREGRILVGASGARVRKHLAAAGLNAGSSREPSQEVWLTNAVQSFDDPRANPTDGDIIRELPRLYRELTALPNLSAVVGMGSCALKALSNFQYTDITNRRGSRLNTPYGTKYVPTFHPAFYMRGGSEKRYVGGIPTTVRTLPYTYAPVVQFDVDRAVKESKWPEIRHKYQRKWMIRPESSTQALAWLQHLKTSACESKFLSFDIETLRGANGTWYISCIAFSTAPTEAFCIPLMRRDRTPYWPNISTECLIWRTIAEVLNLPNVTYVTQNGAAFDAPQLRKHGVVLERMNDGFDTFSGHSLLAPDLPHDLGFLVSIYTDEEYYKDESGRSEYLSRDAGEDMYWTYNCKDAALTLECAYGIMADLREN